MPEQTVGIIGAGIIGLAIGRELVRRRPGTRVVVVDKEDRVAAHQTGHNSGVVHAGIYYEPGSLKATLCARGRQLLRDYCAEKQLPYAEVGKLVVAVTPDDVVRMDALAERAGSNGVPGLRRIDAGEIREIEPHATGLAALHSPHTAITDYPRIAAAFADEITAAGGEVRLSFPVTAVTRAPNGIHIGSDAAAVVVDRLIVCAGLHSDTVAGLAGDRPGPRIVPFRGEYMLVRPERTELVRGLIYPVPDPRYPFLGVHFTRRVNGEVEVGPNAVLAFAREGYRRSAVSARDLRDLTTWPGPGEWRAGTGAPGCGKCTAHCRRERICERRNGMSRISACTMCSGPGRVCGRRPSMPAVTSSTISASTGSARSPRSATRPPPRPPRVWPSPSMWPTY